MSELGDGEPQEQTRHKPPRRYWKAGEPFIDLKLSHWVEIVLTGALVFVGIAQLCAYERQAGIMATQTKLISTQAAIAAEANSLTAAIQRAFVVVQGIDIIRVHDKGEDNPSWWFVPIIENVGYTPTQSTSVMLISGLGKIVGDQRSWPTDPDRAFTTGDYFGEHPIPKIYYAPIAPKAKVWFDVDPAGTGIPFEDIQRWSKDNAFQVVMGVIHYNDTLPKTSAHVTKYCYIVRAYRQNDNSPPRASYAQCKHWNCADDECKEDKQRYDDEKAISPKP